MAIIQYEAKIKNKGTVVCSVKSGDLDASTMYGLKCWILRNHTECNNVIGTDSVTITDFQISFED